MKKIIALTLALGMTVGIASACGKKAEPVEEETEAIIEEETEEEVEDETEPVVTEEVTEASKASEGVVNNVPSTTAEYGVLYTIIDDKNDDQHYIKGVSLGGNQTGSSEFNSKEPSTDSIRCVFLLNEWISVTLDDEAPDEVQVYVFKFVDDLSLYKDVDFNGDIEGYVAMATLTRPEEEGAEWGEFYVNPEDADPSDFSLVFVYQGKAVSQIRIALFAEGSLQDLSDSELEALTK